MQETFEEGVEREYLEGVVMAQAAHRRRDNVRRQALLGNPERTIRVASRHLSDGYCDYYLTPEYYVAVGLHQVTRHDLVRHTEERGHPDYVEWEVPHQSTVASVPGAVLHGPVISRDGVVAPVTAWHIPDYVEDTRTLDADLTRLAAARARRLRSLSRSIAVGTQPHPERVRAMCEAFTPANRRGWGCSPTALVFPISSNRALVVDDGCTMVAFSGVLYAGLVTPGRVIRHRPIVPQQVVVIGRILWLNQQPFGLGHFNSLTGVRSMPSIVTSDDNFQRVGPLLAGARVVVFGPLSPAARLLLAVRNDGITVAGCTVY